MRSNPLGIIRGLGEVVSCIYGPAVTYAFTDPVITAYRHSVVYAALFFHTCEIKINSWTTQFKKMMPQLCDVRELNRVLAGFENQDLVYDDA